MLFASSLISVEKYRAGPGFAGNPRNPERCEVKHEIVALILTVIRPANPKRRTRTARACPAHISCVFNAIQRIVRFCTAARHVSMRAFLFMPASFDRLARFVKLLVLPILLFPPVLAHAQESSDRQDQQNQQQQQATPEKKEKEPPPPLFLRHRRGIYTNALGVAVVDATPQSPPLETDDPGVPDKGEYEINLTTHADFSKELRTFDFFFVDANYGIVPKILGHDLPTQVKFEFPLAGAKASGDSMKVGIGAAKFGLKFNFYNNEQHGLYISLYPQIEFAIPGSNAAEKGLAEPGQTLILPLLVQKEFKYLTFVANGIIEEPIHNPAEDTTGTLGFGFGRAITRHTALMAEVRFTSTFDLQRERLLVLNSGLMRHIRDNVVLYANVGRGVFSDEGTRHIYVGVGVKFLLTPNEAAGKK
jgi:hypothetical protein